VVLSLRKEEQVAPARTMVSQRSQHILRSLVQHCRTGDAVTVPAAATPTAATSGKKVYISVDIEGVGGIAHWVRQLAAAVHRVASAPAPHACWLLAAGCCCMPQDEAAKLHSDYPQFAQRMTAEAVAACEGALAAGATEIVVRDAHGSGRNILQEQLPREAKLIRGWSGHPYANILGVDTEHSL
jgi:hypothetical protein